MKNLIDYIPYRDALSRMQGMFTPVERGKMAICLAILVEITAIVLWEIHKGRLARRRVEEACKTSKLGHLSMMHDRPFKMDYFLLGKFY